MVVEIAIGGVVGPCVADSDGLFDGVAAEDNLVAFESGLGPLEKLVLARDGEVVERGICGFDLEVRVAGSFGAKQSSADVVEGKANFLPVDFNLAESRSAVFDVVAVVLSESDLALSNSVEHASHVLYGDASHEGMVGIGAVLGTGLGKNSWLMLDLGKVEEFSQGFLKERHSRILEYVVEYPDPESKD